MSGKRFGGKTPANFGGKRRRVEADDEEEEYQSSGSSSSSSSSESSSSPSSDDSSSESDADADVGEFDDGYDDQLIGDEEDRKYLDSLDPLRREEELGERYRAREVKKKLFEIKQANRLRELELAKGKKKAGAKGRAGAGGKAKPKGRRVTKGAQVVVSDDDGDDETYRGRGGATGPRRVLRDRAARAPRISDDDSDSDVGGGGAAAPAASKPGGVEIVSDDDESEYSGDDVAAVKAASRNKRSAGGGRRRGYSFDEAESESEDSEAERQRRVEEAEPLTTDVIALCQLTRASLVKHRDEPYFPRMIKGMFVRVTPSIRSYVLAQIAGRESTRSYKVDGVRTTTMLVCRIGKATKNFRLTQVSNQPVSERELDHYKSKLASQGVKLVTATWCRKRAAHSEHVKRNHKYTEEEIQQLVGKRQADIRAVPNITQLKLKTEQTLQLVTQNLQEAEDANDTELAEELRQQLAKVETRMDLILKEATRREQQYAEADRKRVVTGTINQKAAKYNKAVVHEVFKREVANARNISERAKEEAANPFQRRRCAPELLWAVKGVNDDGKAPEGDADGGEGKDGGGKAADGDGDKKTDASDDAKDKDKDTDKRPDVVAELRESIVHRRAAPRKLAVPGDEFVEPEEFVQALVSKTVAELHAEAGAAGSPPAPPAAGSGASTGDGAGAGAGVPPSSGRKKLSFAEYRRLKGKR